MNRLAWTFSDGTSVARVGFGTVSLMPPDAWGDLRDRSLARDLLNEMDPLGVQFLDTADCYGPYACERFLGDYSRDAGSVPMIATKGGFSRGASGEWLLSCRPEQIRHAVVGSLQRLGLEQLPIWFLHRVDPKIPHDEQFDAVAALQREGLVKHVGLCAVGVDVLKEALRAMPVAAVQSHFNIYSRRNNDVVRYCEQHGIAFVAYSPLDEGAVSKSAVVERIALSLNVTPAQVMLAWLLHHSPSIIAIPGTSSMQHLRENATAARISLSPEQLRDLDRVDEADS